MRQNKTALINKKKQQSRNIEPAAQIVGSFQIRSLKECVGDGTDRAIGGQPEINRRQLKHQTGGLDTDRVLHDVAIDGTQKLLKFS